MAILTRSRVNSKYVAIFWLESLSLKMAKICIDTTSYQIVLGWHDSCQVWRHVWILKHKLTWSVWGLIRWKNSISLFSLRKFQKSTLGPFSPFQITFNHRNHIKWHKKCGNEMCQNSSRKQVNAWFIIEYNAKECTKTC